MIAHQPDPVAAKTVLPSPPSARHARRPDSTNHAVFETFPEGGPGDAAASLPCAILSTMNRVLVAPLIANKRLPRDNWMLTVLAPEIAETGAPGQFVMASDQTGASLPHPLLRRALAIYDTGREDDKPATIRLLVKAIGEGTRRLAALRAGDEINLIGPLGHGFEIKPSPDRIHVLLAGGVGIASVFLLAERLTKMGEQVHLIYGGRSRNDLVCLDDFHRLGIEVVLTTEDGSAGTTGLITDGLTRHLGGFPSQGWLFYACGPNPMLRAVAELAANLGIPCQVSVETRMGCGFGVCLGCSVKTVRSYRLACQQGPVFTSDELIWGEESAWYA